MSQPKDALNSKVKGLIAFYESLGSSDKETSNGATCNGATNGKNRNSPKNSAFSDTVKLDDEFEYEFVPYYTPTELTQSLNNSSKHFTIQFMDELRKTIQLNNERKKQKDHATIHSASADFKRKQEEASANGKQQDVSSNDKQLDMPSQSRDQWITIGRKLLTKLYAIKDMQHLVSSEPYNTLPLWLHEEAKGLHDELKLGEERIKQNEMSASVCSAMNNLNFLAKLHSGMKSSFNSLKGNNDSLHQQCQNDYLAAILCIMWALYDIGNSKDKQFVRGSYKMLDTENRLYECLLDYIRFATKQKDPSHVLPYSLSELHKTVDVISLNSSLDRLTTAPSQFAYARSRTTIPLSSHYKQDILQWGIDLRFKENELSLDLLPNNLAHILFGKVFCNDKPFTFIKFEANCLGNSVEAFRHSVEYINGASVTANDRREKDIPQELKDAYAKFCKETQTPLEAKTIHDMIRILSKSKHEKAEDHLKEFVAICIKHSLDYLDIRTGNEVILDMSSCDFYKKRLSSSIH